MTFHFSYFNIQFISQPEKLLVKFAVIYRPIFPRNKMGILKPGPAA